MDDISPEWFILLFFYHILRQALQNPGVFFFIHENGQAFNFIPYFTSRLTISPKVSCFTMETFKQGNSTWFMAFMGCQVFSAQLIVSRPFLWPKQKVFQSSELKKINKNEEMFRNFSGTSQIKYHSRKTMEIGCLKWNLGLMLLLLFTLWWSFLWVFELCDFSEKFWMAFGKLFLVLWKLLFIFFVTLSCFWEVLIVWHFINVFNDDGNLLDLFCTEIEIVIILFIGKLVYALLALPKKYVLFYNLQLIWVISKKMIFSRLKFKKLLT